MRDIRGQLVFSAVVEIRNGDKVQHKRARLGAVYCNLDECEDRLAQFKEDNDFIKESHIHAHFVHHQYFP